MNRLLFLLTGLLLTALPLRGGGTSLAALFQETPAPLTRELCVRIIDLEMLRHPEGDAACSAALLPLADHARTRGDTDLARYILYRLLCRESNTRTLASARCAFLAGRAPVSDALALFWIESLLAADDNPHIALALLNTYTDPSTPNYAVFRARALMRLGRKLDALHAILAVFEPEARHSLPDPVLFALVGDICYANGRFREARLFWRKAVRTYDACRKDPDIDFPIEDHCLLFNVTIGPLRQKYRALNTLLH